MSDNSVLQLRENGQITLPTSIRRKTNLKAGDLLDVKVDDDGTIRLTPQMAIDRSQAYFWSKRWQTGELQAEKDIRAGRVKEFTDVDDLINDLESEK
jgi:AbrB family looped-hinge helix DNA binding protein